MGRKGSSGMSSNGGASKSTEWALKDKSLLTGEGRIAFDVLEEGAGGIMSVTMSTSNNNMITSNGLFTRAEVEAKVDEIKNKLKEAGVKNAVSSVKWWNAGIFTNRDDVKAMRITVTMKKAYSSDDVK